MLDKHRNADGTHNGVAILADVSGLSRKSVFQISAEVKANHARLKACPGHEFTPILPCVAFNQRYRCIKCAGEVVFHAWHWHEQGRRPR